MRTIHARIITAVAASAAIAALGGCGSSTSKSAASPAHAAPSHAAVPAKTAKATVLAWAKADSASSVCSLMTYGFKLGVGHGQPPAKCTSWIDQVIPPGVSSVQILSTASADTQAVVTARLSGHRQTFYVTSECGTAKIASINHPLPNQPLPPNC